MKHKINTIRNWLKQQASYGLNFWFANFHLSVFSLLILLLIAVSACDSGNQPAEHEHAAEETYTCPMHPQVVQNEPGSCPICGMDLVKQSVEGQEIEVSTELNDLLKPSNTVVVSDIRTVKPVKEAKSFEISFPGVVSYDTRQTYSLPIRFGGRIEQLNVRYNFQQVQKGQKILEIYSPELLTAQRELLFLLESDPDNNRLIEASKQKLRLLGVGEAQINQLIRSRQEQFSFPVYSPYSGYIVEARPAEARLGAARPGNPAPGGSDSGSGMAGMGMGGASASAVTSPSSTTEQAELSLQEGMYVEAGQALFRIIDASQLWAEFNVPADQAGLLQEGDRLELSWGPGKDQHLTTSIDLIQPFFAEGENFSKIRSYLQTDELRVGQLIEGRVQAETKTTLWVPALSVLDLGNRRLTFVKQAGVLHPREIRTGLRAGDMIEVSEGLSTEDAVAYNAQFLIDSESFVELRQQ